MPMHIKQMLYNALFSSIPNYCFLAWGTTSFTNIKCLHLLKKKIPVRNIANAPQLEHTEPIFKTPPLGITSLPQLYETLLLRWYKASVMKNNCFMLQLSPLKCKEPKYSTRACLKWFVP